MVGIEDEAEEQSDMEAMITEAAITEAAITETAKEVAGAEDVSLDSADDITDGLETEQEGDNRIPDAAMDDFLACSSTEGMRTETAPRNESTPMIRKIIKTKTRKTKRVKRA